MITFKVPEEKPDAVSQMRVQSIIDRVQKAAHKIARSPLHKKLGRKYTHKELAAAYLFLSFDEHAEMFGSITESSLPEITERYQELFAFMSDIRHSQYEALLKEAADEDRAA